MNGMARIAEDRGADLKTETEVIGFETAGKRISKVVTTRGDFNPDQIVLAAGSWSPFIDGKKPSIDLNPFRLSRFR